MQQRSESKTLPHSRERSTLCLVVPRSHFTSLALSLIPYTGTAIHSG
uniref:Uncharacterized protein n=1 Tax=Brassica oleracea TaxID=3712 RepID=A0A3P6AH06_BRAOL|nr:unnamed protein product [Brassica oleracea]